MNHGGHAHEEQMFLLRALQGEISLLYKHFIKEAERERDEYAVELQGAREDERMAKRAPREADEVRAVSGLPKEGSQGDVEVRRVPAPATGAMAQEAQAHE